MSLNTYVKLPSKVLLICHFCNTMTHEYEKAGGIDVHKSFLIATILSRDGRKLQAKFNRDEVGILHLRDWIYEHKCPVVACESTNSFWYPIYDAINSPDCQCIVGNAHDMKVLTHKKTDKIDSEMIAKLALNDMIDPSHIATPMQRNIRGIMRFRHFLVKKSTDIKNRIHSLTEANLVNISSIFTDVYGTSGMIILYGISHKWPIERIMEAIPKQIVDKKGAEILHLLNQPISAIAIQELETAIDLLNSLKEKIKTMTQLARSSIQSEHSREYQILCSIPGIGEITALTLISEIGDFKQFSSADKITAWVGLVPKVYQSANHDVRCGITHRGSKEARWVLTEAAHAAVKVKGSRFKKYFDEHKDRLGVGKTIVAIARKILAIAWHLIVNNEIFVDEGGKTKKSKKSNAGKNTIFGIQLESVKQIIELFLMAVNLDEEEKRGTHHKEGKSEGGFM